MEIVNVLKECACDCGESMDCKTEACVSLASINAQLTQLKARVAELESHIGDKPDFICEIVMAAGKDDPSLYCCSLECGGCEPGDLPCHGWIENTIKVVKELYAEKEEAQANNKLLREALEHYANAENWSDVDEYAWDYNGPGPEKALAALKATEGEEEGMTLHESIMDKKGSIRRYVDGVLIEMETKEGHIFKPCASGLSPLILAKRAINRIRLEPKGGR